MTLIIASVFVDTVADVELLAPPGDVRGPDVFELRIDTFREPQSALNNYLRSNQKHTWLITCRSHREGGRFAGDAIEAARNAMEAAQGTGAWVDIEYAAWQTSPQIQARICEQLQQNSTARVVLSHHTRTPPARPMADLIEEMLGAHPQAVAKVAYHAPHAADSFHALDLMHAYGRQVIAIAMGEAGAWTRVLAKKLGAMGTFVSAVRPTAPGQWNVQDLRENFGWDRIDQETKVFGVVGDPVAHSLSPRLFNHWFQNHSLNAVYLPLRVGTDCNGIDGFLGECRLRPWLGVAGLSVTIPQKQTALRWAAAAADPMSREIGAVNTLMLSGDSHAAYNTDSYAAVDSLAAVLGRNRSGLHGLTVDVLGAGGSARAVCHGLSEMGCKITVFARATRDAGDFARWGVTVRDWADRTAGSGDVVINCTPIGMWPNTDESPMPSDALRGRRLVFDLVYRPLRSKLLIEAEAAGTVTLGGLDMFIRQAATQLALWTGINPDTAAARDFLEQFPLNEKEQRRFIALIGARGSGKTTVGRTLATLLDLPHYDTDDMVVADTGRSIRQIFESEGEAGFRRHEIKAVRNAFDRTSGVVSLGGGAVLDPQNLRSIHDSAFVVWLSAPVAILVRRIQADPHSLESRPALTPNDFRMEVEQMVRDREPIYRTAANLVIETAELEPAEVSRRIATHFMPRPLEGL